MLPRALALEVLQETAGTIAHFQQLQKTSLPLPSVVLSALCKRKLSGSLDSVNLENSVTFVQCERAFTEHCARVQRFSSC